MKIQKFLGVGRVLTYPTYCEFIISSPWELIKVLFPLLDKHVLYTTKYLDYVDFKFVVNLLDSLPTTRPTGALLAQIQAIIANMNSTRSVFLYSTIPVLEVVNPYWLLGLIEAEGTFGLKNLSPYFQLGLNIKQEMVLAFIRSFLSSLPNLFNFTLNSLPLKVSQTLNTRTDVLVLSNSSVDALHDYLALFLMSMPFQTRKSVDFWYWSLALYFHKYGHFYLPEGRALVLAISQFINDSRYSTALVPAAMPSAENIMQVLSLTIGVTLTPQMSHLMLRQAFAKLTSIRTIWVYDEGVLVKGSPFTSNAAALRAIDLPRTGSGVKRTIDTGKLFLGRYTFFSKAQV